MKPHTQPTDKAGATTSTTSTPSTGATTAKAASAQTAGKKGLLTVSARAPFHVYYEGQAEVVSAVNAVGPFDILPGHADFFSVLSPCDVVIRRPGSEPLSFELRTGIVTVRDNQVLLFANI